MTLPKTQKGLQSQITKIRSHLSAEKRTHGALDDSYGNRYYLFYLLFLLQDNRRSSSYIRWYEDTCSDDVGEPFQLLLWALILNRMGKNGNGKLGEAMLSNVYMVPAILGEDKAWIRKVYYSAQFREVLEKYLAIEEKLELLPRGDERSRLVSELWKLRESLLKKKDKWQLG